MGIAWRDLVQSPFLNPGRNQHESDPLPRFDADRLIRTAVAGEAPLDRLILVLLEDFGPRQLEAFPSLRSHRRQGVTWVIPRPRGATPADSLSALVHGIDIRRLWGPNKILAPPRERPVIGIPVRGAQTSSRRTDPDRIGGNWPDVLRFLARDDVRVSIRGSETLAGVLGREPPRARGWNAQWVPTTLAMAGLRLEAEIAASRKQRGHHLMVFWVGPTGWHPGEGLGPELDRFDDHLRKLISGLGSREAILLIGLQPGGAWEPSLRAFVRGPGLAGGYKSRIGMEDFAATITFLLGTGHLPQGLGRAALDLVTRRSPELWVSLLAREAMRLDRAAALWSKSWGGAFPSLDRRAFLEAEGKSPADLDPRIYQDLDQRLGAFSEAIETVIAGPVEDRVPLVKFLAVPLVLVGLSVFVFGLWTSSSPSWLILIVLFVLPAVGVLAGNGPVDDLVGYGRPDGLATLVLVTATVLYCVARAPGETSPPAIIPGLLGGTLLGVGMAALNVHTCVGWVAIPPPGDLILLSALRVLGAASLFLPMIALFSFFLKSQPVRNVPPQEGSRP